MINCRRFHVNGAFVGKQKYPSSWCCHRDSINGIKLYIIDIARRKSLIMILLSTTNNLVDDRETVIKILISGKDKRIFSGLRKNEILPFPVEDPRSDYISSLAVVH